LENAVLVQEWCIFNVIVVGDTRFGTSFIMMERLVQVRSALQKMMVDDQWTEYMGQAGQHAEGAEGTAGTVGNPSFWKKVVMLVDIIRQVCGICTAIDHMVGGIL
jgi:hypothetical protein